MKMQGSAFASLVWGIVSSACVSAVPVFAAIFILTAEAILLFIAVSVLERIICPWAREGKR